MTHCCCTHFAHDNVKYQGLCEESLCTHHVYLGYTNNHHHSVELLLWDFRVDYTGTLMQRLRPPNATAVYPAEQHADAAASSEEKTLAVYVQMKR